LYGTKLASKDILLTERKGPAEARALISSLNRYSRHEEKDGSSEKLVG
jgi:hypothetical protein